MASKTLDVTLNAKDNMSPAFAKAGNAAENLGTSLNNLGKSGSGFQSFTEQVQALDSEITTVGQALTGFGAATTAAIGLSVRQFAGLEQAMANVASIAGGADIAAMTTQVRELAVELGTSPTGLAEGLYDLISSGISAADAMEVLETAAIAARAGMTDTATASRAITAVLNAYGLEATEAANVSDVLFQTVNEGVITFEGLANNLQNVIPLAASLNIGIEEVGAAFKELTLQGFSASTAETGIAAFMRSAIRPTEELTEAVQEYGYASVEALVQAEGLEGLLRAIEDASGGSATAMLELLGTSEATTAVLALLANGADGFALSVDGMEASMQDGATTMATYQTQMDTLVGDASRLRAAFGELTLTLGEAFAPLAGAGIDAATGAISGLTEAVQALPGPLQTAVAGIAGLSGGTALLAGGFLLLLPRIVETRNALRTLGGIRGTLGLLAGAINPVTLGIGALTLGVGALIMQHQRQAEEAQRVVDIYETMQGTLQDLRLEGINTSVFEGYVDAFRDIQTIADTPPPSSSFFDQFEGDMSDSGRAYTEFVKQFDVSTQEFADANDVLRQAMTDSRIDTEAFFEEIDRLIAKMTKDQFDEFGPDWFFNEVANLDLSKFRREADETAASVDNLWASMLEGGGVDPNDIFGSVFSTIDETRAKVEENRKQVEEWNKEVAQSVLAIAGWDNALSQLNMTGLTGELALFAEEGIRAGQSFDNTFRILVSNVQQYGQGIQQATDWMGDLVTVNEEGWSKVGQLVTDQRISWEEGEAAVAAYNQTLAANEDIQQNLLAVQAMQAPFIAQNVEATRAWVQELANMDAQTQRTTLAFMDMQTVSQAQEIITLGNSEAFAQMGDSGRMAFEAMIQGALQTNPLLFNVLETMGIISGTPLDFEVDYSALEGAGSAIEQLTTEVGYLVDTLREIYNLDPIRPEVDTSDIEAAASPGGPLGLLKAGFDALRDAHASPTVDVQTGDGTGGAPFVLDDIARKLGEVDGTTATATVNVIAGNAATGDGTGGAGNWRDILGLPAEGASLPPITQTVDIETTGEEKIAEARDAINELEDRSVTVSINVDSGSVGDLTALLTSINDTAASTVTVDVLIGTNELDTGLLDWGIGGGGGGGRGGFTAKSVSVDLLIGDNQLDTIGDGTYGPVMVDVQANTTSFAASLATLSLGMAGMGAVEIPITADDSAFWQEIAGLDGIMSQRPETTVTVTADTGTAVSDINAVTSAADAVPTSVSTTAVALTGGAIGALNATTAAANAVPTSVSTTAVALTGGAVAALNAVANAAANIPGSVSTTAYVNTVYTTTYRTVGSAGAAAGGFFQHGGIPSYATGGVLFRGGEAGPELAHFANGGTALLPRDGLYMAPPMTYISPNNTQSYDQRTQSGDTYELHVHGNVYGIDDLAEAMEGAVTRRRRGFGQVTA